MKTTKFFSLLSLALIFIGVTSGFCKNIENPSAQDSKLAITRYLVNIHLAADKPVCNTYWIQITDETGRLVAPAQIFVPGISQYSFYSNIKERGFRERGTKRIAMLIKAPVGGYLDCVNNLFARPDTKTGIFLLGKTYNFDLFPVWETHIDVN